MHKAPCHILSLDIVDVTGVHVVDVQGKLFKHKIDKEGKYIGFHDMVSINGSEWCRWTMELISSKLIITLMPFLTRLFKL